jgi:imidazolonepropionase-like amidohydrolase
VGECSPPTEPDDRSDDGVVLVEDGTIVDAGPRDAVSVPDAAERVDHDVVLPGLIDAHVH